MSDVDRVVSDLLEVGELVHILSPASRREQGVARLDVFPVPIVGVEESFRMKPDAICFVGLSASTQTHEWDVRIDGLVGVTARVDIAVRRSAITDDRSTSFDPYIKSLRFGHTESELRSVHAARRISNCIA
jgi:hypothetical protein